MNISNSYKLHGFSLLEMLIALMVLSIGLLGIAAMQTRGQQHNLAAYTRTQATILANDLMDRIRANPTDIDGDGRKDDYEFDHNSPPSPPSNGCDQTGATVLCTPAQLRDYDLFAWEEQIEKMFPGGYGSVVYKDDTAAQNPERYEIEITWALRDVESDTPGSNETRTLRWVMKP
jgi:type IV pilus assembly protein PilV